jgi:hypothetical protein
MKRKMSWKASLLLCLYSSYYSIALPVRIASNGIDSVVLTPEGGKDTVVIDTNKNLHGRIDRIFLNEFLHSFWLRVGLRIGLGLSLGLVLGLSLGFGLV